jgi:hypothetical protein
MMFSEGRRPKRDRYIVDNLAEVPLWKGLPQRSEREPDHAVERAR